MERPRLVDIIPIDSQRRLRRARSEESLLKEVLERKKRIFLSGKRKGDVEEKNSKNPEISAAQKHKRDVWAVH